MTTTGMQMPVLGGSCPKASHLPAAPLTPQTILPTNNNTRTHTRLLGINMLAQ